jgi:uncharacterized membrane protein
MGNLSSWVAWVHVASVVVAIGGVTFILFVLRPTVLRLMEPPEAMRFMGAVQMRWRWVVWGSLSLLVITGFWMAWAFQGMTSLDVVLDTSYGRTLLLKSALAGLLMLIAMTLTLPMGGLAWFRRHQVGLIRFNLSLAAIIVLLASLLVRYGGII